VQTYTAKHASEGVELGRRHCPNLIVLDLEIDDINLEYDKEPFWANLGDNNVPIILLGNPAATNRQFQESEFVG